MSLRRERPLLLALLLILAVTSWALLIWQSRTATGMGMGLTMGMGAAFFLAIWVVMMIAMSVKREGSLLGMLRFGKKSAHFLCHQFRLAASIGTASIT